MKKFSLLVVLCTVGIVLCALALFMYGSENTIDFSMTDLENFVTPAEIDTSPLARQLYEQGHRGNPSKEGLFSFTEYFSKTLQTGISTVSRNISSNTLYQNLASPSATEEKGSVKIQEGFRKEQIADQFAKKLSWSEKEKKAFLQLSSENDHDITEGNYFPGDYVVDLNEDPKNVSRVITEKFNDNVQVPYEENKTVVNLNTILTIASMIQREAGGKSDMPIISGIMWNRLFNNWPLQIDATIQYVKGNEKNWWPRITSKDIRTTDSPYNTYLYKGLPPSPISNPGIAAINAALHPKKTSCFFYLHDSWGGFHCSATYEGHEANIERFLGDTYASAPSDDSSS